MGKTGESRCSRRSARQGGSPAVFRSQINTEVNPAKAVTAGTFRITKKCGNSRQKTIEFIPDLCYNAYVDSCKQAPTFYNGM